MWSIIGAVLAAVVVLAIHGIGRWLISRRRACFDAFEGTGVPTVPLLSLISGNSKEFWKPTSIKRIDQWLNEYGDVFGFFIGDAPFMVIKDLDMINDIFIKESNNFSGRGHMFNMQEQRPIFAKYMIFAKGSLWKISRNCMSQFFTSSKLKAVMPSLLHAQQQFIDILGEHSDREVDVDINSLCERFTFDVIAKAAFGIDTDVQRNPENPLFKNSLAVIPTVATGVLYHLGQNLYHWPWLLSGPSKLLGAIYENPMVEMTKKAAEIIMYRRKSPQVRIPDMAQMLLDGLHDEEVPEAEKHELPKQGTAPLPPETLYQLASNCMVVFLGGYDTTRLVLTNWFYLMGKYPDVQEKMRQEVLAAFAKEVGVHPKGDHLSLLTLNLLRYSNQVISETMRLYPPIITFTTRCAEEDYRYGKYLIKKGTSVMAPTYQLHHDPQYWIEPEKFDPERFSPENKRSVNPTAYIPFGLGPRICLGQRLALAELASATAQVLRHYSISLGESQKRDLEMDTYSVMATPKEKVFVRLRRLSPGFIQEDLFADLGSMTQLRELVISATGKAVSRLVDLIRSLLRSASLSTLSLSGLRLNAINSQLLVKALRRNRTVTDLSVHSSILHSWKSKGVPWLSVYLKESTTLSALTLEGMNSEPENTLKELRGVLAPEIAASSLEKLKLSGFLLEYGCVCLLSSYVAKQGGSLKHLDISGCRWVLEGSQKSLDTPTDDVQPFEQHCVGLEPLDKREEFRLSHLSVNVKGLKLHEFKTLLFVATTLESVRTILICDVALDVLPEICRAVRQAEIRDMVHITDEYLVDPVALSKLEHFREAVCHVVVSCLRETSVSAFCKTVHLVRSWNHVTTFRLTILKEAMRDIFMMWSLCCYVNEANTLKELELRGCNKPDLSTCLGEVTVNQSLLLQVIFSNSSLRTLRLSQIRLGEVNLNFMVDDVYCNDTLTELDFSIWDLSENDGLLRLLAIDFDINETLLRLHVSNTSCNDTQNEGWAVIKACLSRNVGFFTCASHYVVQFADDNRCMEALASIRRSRALIDKVQELTAIDEADAACLVEALVTIDFP